MATITWPPALPQTFKRDSYQEEMIKNTIVSDFDVGPSGLRRRVTANVFIVTGSMFMTTDEWEDMSLFLTEETLERSLPFGFPEQGLPDSAPSARRWLVFMDKPPSRSWLAEDFWLVDFSFVVLPSGPAIDLTLVDHGSATSGSFGTQDLGAADADRILFLAVAANHSAGTAETLTGVTIRGISATRLVGSQTPTSNSAVSRLDVWYAAVPLGTTGTISITTTYNRFNWALYRATDVASLTVYDSVADNHPIEARDIDVPIGGAIIALVNNTTTTPFALDSVTNDHAASAGTANYAAIGHDVHRVSTTVEDIFRTPESELGQDTLVAVSFR
jgi:hypothetical protein